MSPILCVIIFVVNFISYFVKGVAGFGDPLISSPLLSMVLENKVISPNNLLLNTPLNGYIAWKNRRAFSLKATLPILAFILLGVIPGTLMLKYAASWVLKAGLGVLILGIGVEMITRDLSKPIAHNNMVMALACFCSGITSGLYGINLFFVAYVERTAKGREEFRGNICFVFFIENVFRIIVYALNGVITRDVLLLAAISLPGMLFGFLTGSVTDKRLSDRAVRNIVITMFMLGGFSILLRALIWRV